MVQKKKTIKSHCVRNAQTRRCRQSEHADATSKDCVYFDKTMRCRNLKATKATKSPKATKATKATKDSNILIIKNENERGPVDYDFYVFYDYKVKKSVKAYLNKEIIKKSGKKLRENIEEGHHFPSRVLLTDKAFKDYLAKQVLKMAKDENQTDVISLEMVKRVIQNDPTLNMVILNKS
jgi:hypothetical protein